METWFPYSAAAFAAAAVQILLAVVALHRRNAPGARAFLALTVSGAVYAAGYGMELASPDLPRILFWNHVQYVGIAFLPAFWAVFSVQVVGGRLPRAWVRGLLALSTASLVLDLTESYHGLFHMAPRLRADAPFPVLAFDIGPVFWLQALYCNAVLLFSNVRLAIALRRVPPPWRNQYAVLAVGSLLPWAGLALHVQGLAPWGLDLSVLSLAAAAPVFAWGVFRLGLMDLAPVARERVFEYMRDAVLVVDHVGRVLDYNPAARHVFPSLTGKALGRPVADAGLPSPVAGRLSAPEDGEFDLETPVDGAVRSFRGQVSSVRAPGGRGAARILTLMDVTRFACTIDELRAQAYVDALTGALSRRRFQEVLDVEVARSRRHGHALAALLLDLDRFKAVNDTFGHDAGDRVLAAVVASCRELLRASDAIGRIGGEEFAILLPETGTVGARIAAERLRQRVAALRVPVSDGRVARVTVSIGVAAGDPSDPASFDALVDAADRGLYRAKRDGRNLVGQAEAAAPAPE